MKAEEKKLRKDKKKEVRNNIGKLLSAAREGRLFIASKTISASRQEVVENVRRYVSPLAIRPLRCSPTVGNGKLKKLKTYVLVSKKRNLY